MSEEKYDKVGCMAAIDVSVIICTHNPRSDYLARVLHALKAQSLCYSAWELLIIDNASEEHLSQRLDLSWHPAGRHFRENELGLTSARIYGIRKSSAELIVFVDDDNVLKSDYLSNALAIARAYSFLGAWGGSAFPVFDSRPPSWSKSYWHLLAVRTVAEEVWTNSVDADSTPAGAGLCIRRRVAELYVEKCQKEQLGKALGRRGTSLISGEDYDLVHCSRLLKLGWGLFPLLQLEHLIPDVRTTKTYIARLIEGMSATHVIFQFRADKAWKAESWLHWVVRIALDLIRGRWLRARFSFAEWRGRRVGRHIVDSISLPASRSNGSL